MATKQLLGARIKELRKQKGITQDKLAELVNIESRQISRIEVGNCYPSFDTLEKIADALDVELKDFFEFNHHISREDLIKEINTLLNKADDNKIKIAYRILYDVIN